MIFNKHPSLKEFMTDLNYCVKETCCMSNPEGTIGSHNIVGHINICCDDADEEYEISYIEIDRLGGCGCESGITINVKKVIN